MGCGGVVVGMGGGRLRATSPALTGVGAQCSFSLLVFEHRSTSNLLETWFSRTTCGEIAADERTEPDKHDGQKRTQRQTCRHRGRAVWVIPASCKKNQHISPW